MNPIRETRLDDVRIFRCRGPVHSLPPSGGDRTTLVVDDGANVILDDGGKAIGWARYSLQPSPNGAGLEIVADAILDHESEARLMAENGELGLRVTLVASRHTYEHNGVTYGERTYTMKPSVLLWVPPSYAHKLEPIEADWKSLFI